MGDDVISRAGPEERALSKDEIAALSARMSFLMEAVTLRELRGWPNEPVHNAAIIYELYGWRFDAKDAQMIRDEVRARKALDRLSPNLEGEKP